MGLFSFFKKSKPVAATIPQNGYEGAAAYSTDRSIIWHANTEDSVNPPPATRAALLKTTRYLVNNYPLFERILSVSEQYGVGQGLIANAATSDNEYNDKATKVFDKWANSVFCSSNNQATLYQMQRLIVRELLQANECFVVLIKTESGYPQIMLASSEQVRHSGEKDDDSVDGLYVDNFGKVTAYNIFVGTNCIKVEASNVIHLLRQRQIGQLRGVSQFASATNSARDAKDIVTLTKQSVKTHSALTTAITRKNGQAGDGLFNDLQRVQNSNGTASRGIERASNGTNIVLNEGEKVELLTSDRPSENLTSFIQLLAREVCLAP